MTGTEMTGTGMTGTGMTGTAAPARASVVVAAALSPQPWRNGGGTTREIHAAPAGSHPFPAWRLSLASIAADGPFSTFPQVHRSLLLVSQTALRLEVEGRSARLGYGEALDFPGEAAVSARIDGTPSDALNLMTCRACGRGSWQVRDEDGEQHLSAADALALVLLDGQASVDGQRLERHDAVVLGRAPAVVSFRSARVAAARLAPAPAVQEAPLPPGEHPSHEQG